MSRTWSSRARFRAPVLSLAIAAGCQDATVGNTPVDARPDILVVIKMDAAPDVPPDAATGKDTPGSTSDQPQGNSDARPDGKPDSADAGVCKHEFNNPACWESFDVNSWIGIEAAFRGAIFDGTYVNFLNSSYGDATSFRYDPTKPFSDDASWSGFGTWGDVSDFSTTAFDGRYIYLIPSSASDNGTAGLTFDDVIGRYDTTASKLSSSAWSSFNLTKANGTTDLTVPGYAGGAFDGRYLYFAPYAVGDQASGKAMRYDTQAPFATVSAWSWFDLTSVDTNAKGFEGAVFDGQFVYFIPNSSVVNPFTGDYVRSGLVVRYDTRSEFAQAASWSTFDTATLSPAARGFSGATFDGRYLYMAPCGEWREGVVPVRYDTQGAFADAASWRSFDISHSELAGGDFSNSYFYGASFDGRHVYYFSGDGTLVLRYDTRGDFSSVGAWESVGLWSIGAGSGFRGGVFDGQYLYVVPRGYGPILRFNAVSPPALPPGYRASFY